ncbi:MAG: Gfo/Idh/MocA family oxidoreductase [SAR202 cluster bacterium]|nr:Gfo/Idh/MocA family oxidoreductase [SAR202 cluster bacterium]
MSTGRRLKLGLVGVGRWGQRFIKTAENIEGVDIEWVASTSLRNGYYKNRIKVISDWHDFATLDIDGAIIATPPDTHAEILENFIASGIPSIVEKPLCLNIGTANHLNELSTLNDVPVLVDHTQLFQPAFEALHKRVTQLGSVRYIRSEGMGMGPFRSNVPILWDWSPHDISMCLTLLAGLPKYVYAAEDQNFLTISLDFGQQIKSTIVNSNVFPEKRRSFCAYMDSQLLHFTEYPDARLTEYKLGLTESQDFYSIERLEPIKISSAKPLDRVVRYFAQGIKEGGNQDRFGLDLACDVLRVIEAASQSLSKNVQIRL